MSSSLVSDYSLISLNFSANITGYFLDYFMRSAETLMSQDEGSCPKNVKLVKV